MKEDAFSTLLQNARLELHKNPQFSEPMWKWVLDLDDESTFIFCYVQKDFKEGVVDYGDFEQTVYDLTMLKSSIINEKTIPNLSTNRYYRFQLLFNLYEKLKEANVSWDDCIAFVKEQALILAPSDN